MKQPCSIHGWLNIDKPLGMSSAKVVGKVKWLLKPEKPKIGHAGTLDPLASGVLPIALGEATKTSGYMMDARKIYRFTVQFGVATSTDDAEGEVTEQSEVIPTRTEVEAVLGEFLGKIDQIPPIYSALKVDGKRAYALARAGEEVELASREVMIHRLEVIEAPSDSAITLEVECGKGTYVRSLARDVAQKCGTCGHVSMLQRAAVGKFGLSDAISLDLLEEMVHKAASSGANGVLEGALMPLAIGLDDIPALTIGKDQAAQLRHGQPLTLAYDPNVDAELVQVEHAGNLVAIASLSQDADRWLVKSKRIFNEV